MTDRAPGPRRPDDLVSLVYTSEVPDPDPPLRAIVEECRRFNEGNGVTGLLLYHRGRFLQYLEGERARVLQSYERIKADPRHRDCAIVSVERLEARRFSDFAMAYQRADPADADVEGFSGLLETAFARKTLEENPEAALQIVLAFAQTGLR